MSLRAVLDDLREMFVPLSWRFKCTECRDTGWASYADRIGPRIYHVADHCRSCKLPTPPRRAMFRKEAR